MQIAAKALLPDLQAGPAAKRPTWRNGSLRLTGLLQEWAQPTREPIEISGQTAIWVK